MDPKKELSPNSNRAKDLHDVEMLGGSNSPKLGVKPDVHIANEKKNTKDAVSPEKPHQDSDAQPLLESDRGRQKPPLAGPEVDDLDGDEKPKDAEPYPGIDDGLLEPADKKPNGKGHHDEGQDEGSDVERNEKHPNGDGIATEDGKWWHDHDEPDFPYDGFGPRSNFDPDRPISPMIPGSIPDVNTYQQKKNLAQGMMDLALLSANANQLRYVLESSNAHPYFYPSVAFISLSIILQIAVGVGLIMNSRYNVKDDKDICKADKINNMTVLGVFLVTIVNVFITSFSVATPNTSTATIGLQTDNNMHG